MAKKSETVAAEPSFEQALTELESLVETMERGDQTLEQSLAAFERGVQLTRFCQQALSDAEQKVEILMQQQGENRVIPYAPNDPA
jgi:exodeoxyribonuclease VII small subunit